MGCGTINHDKRWEGNDQIHWMYKSKYMHHWFLCHLVLVFAL